MFEALKNASIVGLLSLIVALLPLAAGIAYALRPSEQRLALMRPVSLAGIFAGLCGLSASMLSLLRLFGESAGDVEPRGIAIGAAEAMVPLVVAFGSLTVAWLCVATGMRRQS